MKNRISGEANQHWRKETSSTIYLRTDLPNTVKDHLAGKMDHINFGVKGITVF